DHVRLMAQEVAHGIGEGETGGAVDLHLLDVVDVELDRILDGEDVDALLAQLQQHRVQRRGLAAAGRAGGEVHAVVAARHVLDAAAVGLAEAELVEVPQALAGVQQPHLHALAVYGTSVPATPGRRWMSEARRATASAIRPCTMRTTGFSRDSRWASCSLVSTMAPPGSRPSRRAVSASSTRS